VHVYASDEDGWWGVRNPVASIRIMDESQFLEGRVSRDEGGPKGIDVDAGSNVLVATSVLRPLAFFDIRAILEAASGRKDAPASDPPAAQSNSAVGIGGDLGEKSRRDQRALDVRYELHVLEEGQATKKMFDYMRNSSSWRITAPLRRLHSALRRFGQ
jgi:hypothetical protein